MMHAMELPWERPNPEWQPVSRGALIAWLVFYALLLLQAARAPFGQYLLFDYVNFFAHEGGHFFFSWFGDTVMILGGTLAQLLVPILLATYFTWHRHTTAVAFCAFWFFENFLNVGTYMQDALLQTLPLTTDQEGHDWINLFARWDVLGQAHIIGRRTRMAGWAGMLASLAWFAWKARQGGASAANRARAAAG